MNIKKNLILFFVTLVLFLSGAIFLIYEISWQRELSLILGTTVTASAYVLSGIMGGLGLGSIFWGKYIVKSHSPLKTLANILIGASLTTYILFFTLQSLPVWGNRLSAYVDYSTISIIFALIAVFIPAFLMGGVLPVCGHIYVHLKDKEYSKKLGLLYFIETLGSTTGSILAGFILLRHLGQTDTMNVATGANILFAIFIYLLVPKESKNLNYIDKPETISKGNNKMLLVAFAAGLGALVLQIIWIRILSIYLPNTSYTFSIVSAFMIAGLFLGSYIFSKVSTKIKSLEKGLIITLIAYGLLITASTLAFKYAPEIILIPLANSIEEPFLRIILPAIIVSVVTILPVSTVSGFLFPMYTRLYRKDEHGAGSTIGTVYAVNTLGSVIGPFIAVFILIPIAGISLSIGITGILISIVALYLVVTNQSIKKYSIIAFVCVIITAGFSLYSSKVQILPPSFSTGNKNVLFFKESKEGTVVVGEEVDTKAKSTYINNAQVIGADYDAVKVVKLLGHLPFLCGNSGKDVLVVGFGMGVTAATIASHESVENMDCVELALDILDASKFYHHLNNEVEKDSRINFHEDDGRNFLSRTDKKYDIISSDPTHPVLGSSNLYSVEYFRLIRNHLKSGGMVTHYMPLHKLRKEEFLGLVKTFYSVFPTATLWMGQSHAVLLGTKNPLSIDFSLWEERALNLNDEWFVSEPYLLASALLLEPKDIEKITSDAKINNDDMSYVDFFDPDCFLQENWTKNLSFLRDNSIDKPTIFFSIPDERKLNRFIAGRKNMMEALINLRNGNRQEYIKILANTLQYINQDNPELEILLKLEANAIKQ